ncbi:MAG: hypothetical protein SFV51_27410 [Bryobacteraceae bacterium]|nr:hypothetical protein [Bryobacteraceae bacterium]
MVGKGQKIETRDEEVGLHARSFLQRRQNAFLILVDDLEHDRRDRLDAIYSRYRLALDTMLGELHWRTSVHFLVNMLEAYYFADAKAINAALRLSLQD